MSPSTISAARRRATVLRGRRLLAGATSVALLAVGMAVAVPTASAAGLDLDHGHIDAFTLVYENDTLGLRLMEDVTGHHVLHDPGSVQLTVKASAAMTLPDPVPSGLSFLGASGSTIYYLPQTQDANLVWPGWSTEQLSGDDFANPLRIQVTGVSGPGSVYLWQTGGLDSTVSVLEGGGFLLPGTITPNVNVHAHANWAFTAPGRYTLTAQATGTLKAGGTKTSNVGTYTFDVVAAPAPTPTPTPTDTATAAPTPTATATGPGGGTAAPAPATGTISAGAARQVWGQSATIDATVSGASGGTVVAQVGGRTLTAAVAGGKAAVPVPARALRPGVHPVSLSYHDGVTATATVALTVAKAPARVRASVRPRAVERGGVVRVDVTVTGADVATGRVMVRAAGRTKTVTLNKTGRATVRIAVPANARPGTSAVVARYNGSSTLTAASTVTSLTLR